MEHQELGAKCILAVIFSLAPEIQLPLAILAHRHLVGGDFNESSFGQQNSFF
jgi:hypothetical protein